MKLTWFEQIVFTNTPELYHLMDVQIFSIASKVIKMAGIFE